MLKNVIITVLMILTSFCLYIASIQTINAFKFERGYESMQDYHEAYSRTLGHTIDNSFTCRRRVSE